MSEKDSEQFPEEAGETIYQRDKTAREPRIPEKAEDSAAPKAKPAVKPRKVFKPKKVKAKTDKPMEHRARHLLVTTQDTAEALRQIILEFQEDLAKQPSTDPDKVYEDYDKTEKFFKRLAKKYSLCPSKLVGGDLDWIYREMSPSDILPQEVIDIILKTEKMDIPAPVKSKLGHHVILVCETRVSTRQPEDNKEKMDPRLASMLERDRSESREPGRDMEIPS